MLWLPVVAVASAVVCGCFLSFFLSFVRDRERERERERDREGRRCNTLLRFGVRWILSFCVGLRFRLIFGSALFPAFKIPV